MYKILLEVDGSADSLAAVNVAILLTSLAPQSTVAAQCVLDTPGIWKLLGLQDPGLVGSGPYFQAFESIRNSLRDLAETVLESYQARCNNACFAEILIDEGDWLSSVVERAEALHPLVIVGKSTMERVAKEASMTVPELVKKISYPVVIVDKEQLPSGSFPMFSADANVTVLDLKLLLEKAQEVFDRTNVSASAA
jgi:hypothetical protein